MLWHTDDSHHGDNYISMLHPALVVTESELYSVESDHADGPFFLLWK